MMSRQKHLVAMLKYCNIEVRRLIKLANLHIGLYDHRTLLLEVESAQRKRDRYELEIAECPKEDLK